MIEQPLTLEEIHKETPNILKKIIAICEELGLRYYIAYGSLIGVVRHQGFIPWDDDLDIMMLRPDYEKFKAYCRSHENELFPYKLMGRDVSPTYPYNIYRFCDMRYRMEMDNVPDGGMGMFIDIYPLDGAGNDPEETAKRLKKKWFWMNSVFCANLKKFEPSTKGFLHSIPKFFGYCYAKLRGADYFLGKLESLKNMYPLETSKYIACMVWDYPTKLNEKQHFADVTYMDFEGFPVMIPKDYDAILRESYGDYMKLPPAEMREPHHGYRLYRKAEYFENAQ